ncbi:MAG: FtsX-like permease family protein [Syntrophomonadaceae bacterium]|nr:FtsX-like permease family protein [Syntrophomonadaceae bacterium]
MNFWEMIKMAMENIWANRMRSALTVLGIIIGVMSVIMVVSIGQGGKARILREMEGIGTNIFGVYIGSTDDDYEKYRITLEDCRAIEESVESIEALSPLVYGYAVVEASPRKESAYVYGTDSDYNRIQNIRMAEGRFFSSIDNAVSRRVAVINRRLAEELFGSARMAVGKKLKIQQVSVVVCGVAESGSGMFGPESPMVYMPIKLHFELFDSEESINQIYGSAAHKDLVEESARKAIRVLEVRHQVKDSNVYQFVTLSQQMEAVDQVLAIITMIIGAIAGISLLVGGIGIMNIMLVSVTERTREIGVRMAVGARREDIMRQFLLESVVLSVTGGLVGVVLGVGISAVVCMAMKIPAVISFGTIILALLFSIAVGVFFGIYPANRAAKQDPIEALRYE